MSSAQKGHTMDTKSVIAWLVVGIIVHRFLWGDANIPIGNITYFIIIDAVVSFVVIMVVGLAWVGLQRLGKKKD